MRCKPLVAMVLVLGALAGAAGANAQAPVYHVKEGYFGKLNVGASGSCRFETFTVDNVWYGVVYNETNVEQGWGIITASGQLLFWEADYASISFKDNTDTGVGKDVSYSNLVGQELFDLITARSGCSIEVLEPDTTGRTVMKWDAMQHKDTVNMQARFRGFDASVCQVLTNGKTCSAGSFKGSVRFRGDWSVPD